MPYRLPPLNALRLFEASGRHLSFKLAAEELSLTPSAVSHGVGVLEDWLGIELFHRTTKGLVLTEDGQAYLPEVRAALDRIVAASDALPGRQKQRLVISIAPTFAQRWLLPRLPRFQALHPDIHLELDTSQRPTDLSRDKTDIGIRRGDGIWPDLAVVKLMDDLLVPVAAPALAATIRSTADLAAHVQLAASQTSDDWDSWYALTGQPPVTPAGQLIFDTQHMTWDMAQRGAGVAIGHPPLMQEDLDEGRLVAVLGPPVTARTTYWLVTLPGRRKRTVAAFCDWIQSELAG